METKQNINRNLNKKKLYIFISLTMGFLWILQNIILSVKSSISDKESVAILFPFNYRSNPGLWAYDFTEFIGYSLVIPYLIYSYIKKHILLADKLDKVKAWLILLIVAYCNFVLFFIIVSDNYSITFFLLSIIGGIMLFQISMHITEIFISIFTNHNKKNK